MENNKKCDGNCLNFGQIIDDSKYGFSYYCKKLKQVIKLFGNCISQ